MLKKNSVLKVDFMNRLFLLFAFLISSNIFSQEDCFKIERIDFSKIIFQKEKVILLENQNTGDYGDVLVKVYYFGEPIIKIESIKSDFYNEFIDCNKPIYGEIYVKLIEFFKNNVIIQYEKNVIYSMTFIFKYYSKLDKTSHVPSSTQ